MAREIDHRPILERAKYAIALLRESEPTRFDQLRHDEPELAGMSEHNVRPLGAAMRRPCTEERDEIAAFRLIESHSMPASQAECSISNWQ
jgi:hypothetical protein